MPSSRLPATCTKLGLGAHENGPGVFAYLRHAVCSGEVSLTDQVSMKMDIAPIDAFIPRGPTLDARLRLRFGGSSFSADIVCKILGNPMRST